MFHREWTTHQIDWMKRTRPPRQNTPRDGCTGPCPSIGHGRHGGRYRGTGRWDSVCPAELDRHGGIHRDTVGTESVRPAEGVCPPRRSTEYDDQVERCQSPKAAVRHGGDVREGAAGTPSSRYTWTASAQLTAARPDGFPAVPPGVPWEWMKLLDSSGSVFSEVSSLVGINPSKCRWRRGPCPNIGKQLDVYNKKGEHAKFPKEGVERMYLIRGREASVGEVCVRGCSSFFSR